MQQQAPTWSLIAQVTCQWGLSPGQEARISSVVFLGTMFGSYAWGALSDAKGRRVGFACPALFTFAFGVASALAPNYAVLCALLRVCVMLAGAA